ncbi:MULTISPECIES: S8 family serine peptidase [Natrialbaceae]|uniref:S8 family serine peptidase n=1 Tax=Natrialbaceae TaxID=1644061 RepID=UPI00207C2B31|nr:S8 family serine peptidase [Natronococcus sp. CG52]
METVSWYYSDGQTHYIAETDGGASSEIESAGFEILSPVVDGTVVLVKGPEGAADELSNVRGVSTVVSDFVVELEGPNVSSKAVDTEIDDVVDDGVYDGYLRNEQVQQGREAHEYATGAGQTVAVIDTGVDDTHPDIDVDIERSTTIIDGQPDEHIGDSGYHGTHVHAIATGCRRWGVPPTVRTSC